MAPVLLNSHRFAAAGVDGGLFVDTFPGPSLNPAWTGRNVLGWSFDGTGMNVSLSAGYGFRIQLNALGLSGADDFGIEIEFTKGTAATMIGPWILNAAGTGVVASHYSSPAGLLTLLANSWGYGGDFVTAASSSLATARIRLRKEGTLYWSSRSVDGGATWTPENVSYTWTGTPTEIGFGSVLGSAALTDVIWFRAYIP